MGQNLSDFKSSNFSSEQIEMKMNPPWLKRKDHVVAILNGKQAFRLESIIQFFISHSATFQVCRDVTKYIKNKIIKKSTKYSVCKTLRSTKDIYSEISKADFFNKHLLSYIHFDQDDIPTLNVTYQEEFTKEEWKKICFFESHFIREVNFNSETETYESMILKKEHFLQNLVRAQLVSTSLAELVRNPKAEKVTSHGIGE
ncbi:hypothetical protein ACF0H5_003606 [Mactra antiquata]